MLVSGSTTNTSRTRKSLHEDSRSLEPVFHFYNQFFKKVDREKELKRKLRLVNKSKVDTDFEIWCKITGVTKPEVQKPVEEEESAFDEEYFKQFEKEYAEKKLNG